MSTIQSISNYSVIIEKHVCDVCGVEEVCLSFSNNKTIYNFCKTCIVKQIDNFKIIKNYNNESF